MTYFYTGYIYNTSMHPTISQKNINRTSHSPEIYSSITTSLNSIAVLIPH